MFEATASSLESGFIRAIGGHRGEGTPSRPVGEAEPRGRVIDAPALTRETQEMLDFNAA